MKLGKALINSADFTEKLCVIDSQNQTNQKNTKQIQRKPENATHRMRMGFGTGQV